MGGAVSRVQWCTKSGVMAAPEIGWYEKKRMVSEKCTSEQTHAQEYTKYYVLSSIEAVASTAPSCDTSIAVTRASGKPDTTLSSTLGGGA
jgi:hypothetical protein